MSLKMLRLLHRRINCHSLFPKVSSATFLERYCSAKAVTHQVPDEGHEGEEKDDQLPETKIGLKPRRVRQLKPFKKHLVENLFLGKLDVDVLEFPEVLDDEELDSVIKYGTLIEDAMNSQVNSFAVDSTKEVSKNVMKFLQDYKLFGMTVPRKFGGFEFTETETKYLHEVLGFDSSVSKMLAENEDLGIKLIKMFGSEAQKEYYLPKLAEGTSMISFAYLENGPLIDPNSFNETNVVLTEDKTKFLLSGEKKWVYNAKCADLMIVLASHYVHDQDGLIIPGLSLFLFDKNIEGVIISEPYDKIGLTALETCDVTFQSAEIPADSLLGKPHEGYKMLKKIWSLGKLSIGAECCAIMKRIIHDCLHYCQNNKVFDQTLCDYDYIQCSIGKITCLTYALESVTYMVAGRADIYEDPDLFLESFIVKIFASEALQTVLKEYIQIVGPYQYMKGSYLDRFLRDSNFYALCDETNFNSKLLISALGIRYAGEHLRNDVKEARDPFEHPLSSFWRRLYLAKHMEDKPNLNSEYSMNLNAALRVDGGRLEYCLKRLEFAVKRFLYHSGVDSDKRHYELMQLTDIAVQIYALTATLARASRAICIQLPTAEHDANIASAFSSQVYLKVKQDVLTLTMNTLENVHLKHIGERAFFAKQYPPEHPISRNF